MYTVEYEDGTLTCQESEDLLAAFNRQGIYIPTGCRSGGCGMCKVRVTRGNYQIGTCSKAVLSDADRNNQYILACRTYPKSDISIVR